MSIPTELFIPWAIEIGDFSALVLKIVDCCWSEIGLDGGFYKSSSYLLVTLTQALSSQHQLYKQCKQVHLRNGANIGYVWLTNSVQPQDLGLLRLLPMYKLLPLKKPLPSACNPALTSKVMVTFVWNNREPSQDRYPLGFWRKVVSIGGVGKNTSAAVLTLNPFIYCSYSLINSWHDRWEALQQNLKFVKWS